MTRKTTYKAICVVCKSEANPRNGVACFRFPTDEPWRTEWINFVRQVVPNYNPKLRSWICSRHFPKQLILGSVRKCLRKNAIPVADTGEELDYLTEDEPLTYLPSLYCKTYMNEILLPEATDTVDLVDEVPLDLKCIVCQELKKRGLYQDSINYSKEYCTLFKIDTISQNYLILMISGKFPDLLFSKITHICSQHFQESDITTIDGVKILAPKSIPNLNFVLNTTPKILSTPKTFNDNNDSLWSQDIFSLNHASNTASTFMFSKPNTSLIIVMANSELKAPERPTLCRICFSESKMSKSIFEHSNGARIDQTLISFQPDLKYLPNLTVICDKCLFQLEAAVKMRANIHSALKRRNIPKSCWICASKRPITLTPLQTSKRWLDILLRKNVLTKECVSFLCGTCEGKISISGYFVESICEGDKIYRTVFNKNVATQNLFPSLDADHPLESEREQESVEIKNQPECEAFIPQHNDVDEPVQSPLECDVISKAVHSDNEATEVPVVTRKSILLDRLKKTKKAKRKKKKSEPHPRSLLAQSKICHICGKSFKYPFRLKMHIISVHFKNSVSCPKCDQKFSNTANMRRHDRTIHQKLRLHQCNECGVTYTTTHHLKMHIGLMHTKDLKPVECHVCSRKFMHLSFLKYHLRKDHINQMSLEPATPRIKKDVNGSKKKAREKRPVPFTCVVCDLIFQYRTDYQAHHSKEHPDGSYQCSQCPKKCPSYYLMGAHYANAHKKLRNCKFCEYSSFSQSNVIRHENMKHTRLKMFQCNICEKKLTSKLSLEGHIRTHTGEKPFECEHCGMRFSDVPTIYKHRKKHIDEKYAKLLTLEIETTDELIFEPLN